MSNAKELSWGRLSDYEQKQLFVKTPKELESSLPENSFYLAGGQHRSYGDVGLCEKGFLVDTDSWNKIIDFDWQAGRLTVEAGMSLGALLEICLPMGWILPVLPGTQHVSVAGAIANDIHGKNHHLRGSFGCHTEKIVLHRSDRGQIECSPFDNSDFFRATIGGMGLTGVILAATIKLQEIPSPFIKVEKIRTQNLEDFFRLTEESDDSYEYSVSWIDLSAPAQKMGRGIFMRGNHVTSEKEWKNRSKIRLNIPLEAPAFVLSRPSIQIFNALYYRLVPKTGSIATQDPHSFFFPLDSVGKWNRLYGSRGFYQYQFVIPSEAIDYLPRIFSVIKKSGLQSFLTVLKKFGDKYLSPGLMSFPINGFTLALDFAAQPGLESLFKDLDHLVGEAGGRIYLAKDARLPRSFVKTFYPNTSEFLKFRDPQIKSSMADRLFL